MNLIVPWDHLSIGLLENLYKIATHFCRLQGNTLKFMPTLSLRDGNKCVKHKIHKKCMFYWKLDLHIIST